MGIKSQEFPYLRTRRKPVEAPKLVLPTTPPPKAVKPSIELVRPVRGKKTLPPLDTPILRGNAELSERNPVYRIDSIQSGVGSMIIENADAFAWEMYNLLSGMQLRGEISTTTLSPPEINGRTVVGWHKDDIVMNLRHGAKVRRVIVAAKNKPLQVRFYDGSLVYCPMKDMDNALSITRIGDEFELRLETIGSKDLMGEFGIIPSNIMTDDF